MRKVTVAIAAYDRPAYLDRALSSLSRCEMFDEAVEEIIVSVDDGASNPGARACAQVARVWMESLSSSSDQSRIIFRQPERRGIVGNTVLALKASFDRGADAVLMMEDDAVLAPDALHLASWFLDQDHSRYLLYGFSYSPGKELWREIDSEKKVSEINLHPCPFAYLVHKSNWQFLLDNWCCKSYAPCGWSWSLTYAARMSSRARFLFPNMPRVVNIGRERGTNETPDTWDVTQKDVPLYEGSFRGPYEISRKISDEETRKIDPWMSSEMAKEASQKHDPWLGFKRPKELGDVAR